MARSLSVGPMVGAGLKKERVSDRTNGQKNHTEWNVIMSDGIYRPDSLFSQFFGSIVCKWNNYVSCCIS